MSWSKGRATELRSQQFSTFVSALFLNKRLYLENSQSTCLDFIHIMSRQHQNRTSAQKSSSAKKQSRFVPPAIAQPKAENSPEEQLPEWKPGGSGKSPLSRFQQALQAKLTVGQPNDQYEQEADRLARDVVRAIDNLEADPSEQKESIADVQMQPDLSRVGEEGGIVSREIESEIQSARGNGHSLDTGLQQSMSRATGSDFSGVTIHTDGRSDRLNRALNAKAFTTGSDVFFRQGEYNPSSKSGQELIAHELAHVQQQTGESVQRQSIPDIQRLIYSSKGHYVPNDAAERFLIRQGISKNIATEVIEIFGGKIDCTLGELMAEARTRRQPEPQEPQNRPRRRPRSRPHPRNEDLPLSDTDAKATEAKEEELSPSGNENQLDNDKPTPDRPNVPPEKFPKGTIQDIEHFLEKAANARADGVSLDYDPEVVKWIDKQKLSHLTEVSENIPLLYRGFMYMPEAARNKVLEGEAVSGKARNEQKNDESYDLAAAREDFQQEYLSDPQEDEAAKQEKFAKLRKAVDLHKDSGHGKSNFVGVSANPDYILNWIQPSLSTEFEAYSIALAIVPHHTDILFKSVDLLTEAGCGTSVDEETGQVTDWEDEYLFAGGFPADRVVGYVTIKYKQLPKPTGSEFDRFAGDESIIKLYEAKKRRAIKKGVINEGEELEGRADGDETEKYNYALFKMAEKRQLELERDRLQHLVDSETDSDLTTEREQIEQLNASIEAIEEKALEEVPNKLTEHVNLLEQYRAAEIELFTEDNKIKAGVLEGVLTRLRKQLGLRKKGKFTTLNDADREALSQQTEPQAKIDKTRYRARNDQIYIKKKVLIGGVHETLLMEHENTNELWVWKPEERSSMRASESGGSGLAAEIVGEDLSPRATQMELYHPGLQAWQPGTLQPFKESDEMLTREIQNRDAAIALPPIQVAQMLAHLIADWTIGNYDNHPDQFLVGKEGSIIGLDKGQALKYTYEGTEGSLSERIDNLALEKLDESAFVKDVPFPNTDQRPFQEAHQAITRKLISRIKSGELEVDWSEPHLVRALDMATDLNAAKVREHFETLANEKFADHQEQLYEAIAKRANQIKAQLKQTLGASNVPEEFPDFEE